ncbi:hypothetical protein ACHAWF_002755 [Thalassiosira exigua]
MMLITMCQSGARCILHQGHYPEARGCPFNFGGICELVW